GAESLEAPARPPVQAVVKWYNPEKGLGFVQLADGSGDAFLHISVVVRGGHAGRQRLARCKNPPLPLVQIRAQHLEPLSYRRFVDHESTYGTNHRGSNTRCVENSDSVIVLRPLSASLNALLFNARHGQQFRAGCAANPRLHGER